MIRFAWLQFRTQTIVAGVGLAIVGIALALTGPHLVHLYNTNVAHCATFGNCSTARSAFLNNDSSLRAWLGVLVIVVPGVIGIFWGAPLVAREIEAGTSRLAWTQGITRTRWIAIKLGIVGLASMAVAGLLSLMVTWWASPLDRANMDRYGSFDARNIVPIGYVAVAVALGITLGAVLRRTLPAMATTLVVFVTARIITTHFLRPHLLAPAHEVMRLDPAATGYGTNSASPATANLLPAPSNIANAWIYSNKIVDKAGHPLTPQHLATACPRLKVLNGPGPSPGGGGGGLLGGHSAHGSPVRAPAAVDAILNNCVTKVSASYHQVIAYQPASRSWAFQSSELAIYLAAAAALAGFCIWWVRRH